MTTDPPLPEIHARITAELSRRGWSLLRLSQESGVSYASVHSFAAGGSIRSDVLDKLLAAVELSARAVKARR